MPRAFAPVDIMVDPELNRAREGAGKNDCYTLLCGCRAVTGRFNVLSAVNNCRSPTLNTLSKDGKQKISKLYCSHLDPQWLDALVGVWSVLSTINPVNKLLSYLLNIYTKPLKLMSCSQSTHSPLLAITMKGIGYSIVLLLPTDIDNLKKINVHLFYKTILDTSIKPVA